MTLDGLAAAIARATRIVKAYVATADIFGGFHPRPFILGIAAGLIAPYAIRLLAWVM
jgi:hypothetical protein